MTDLAEAVRRASARELPRAELAAAVVLRLDELGAPDAAAAAARRLAEPGSVVVVAGQQPMLLGGPALVWAKACDAIAVARKIEEEHGVPAVAVFWNASEDHDHAECDHVRMDLGGAVEQLRVALPGDRRMLSRVPVPPDARAVLDVLRAKLPQGPSRDEVLAAIEPADGDTMGSWFSRILLRILGPHGLVVVEPETMRPFAERVVEFEIARPGLLAAAIRAAESESVLRGEPPALELARDELFFLLDDAGRRLRVTRERGAWSVEDGRVLTTDEMRALPPSAFSWNVASRVLAQDIALPVAVQICGPSEISYCERLTGAHEFGAQAPLLAVRSHWTLVPPRAERLARDLGVELTDVIAPPRTPDAGGATPEEPPDVQRLREFVAALPKEGSAAVQRRIGSLVRDVDAYAEALRRDAAERDAVRADRMRRLTALLRPEGEGQDRRISPLTWWAANGLARLESDIGTLEHVPCITAPDYFAHRPRPHREIISFSNRGATT